MKADLLLELQKVLEAVPGVKKVSHGKPLALTNEADFTSIYILPQISTFKNRINTKSRKGYYEVFPVNLLVNTSNDNALDYLTVENNIINYILDDTKLWTTLVDREIITVGYDGYESYPKREFIIQVEFLLKSDC